MAGISYSTLITQIRNYTEVDSNVLTADQLENIILNAQYRIMRDAPIDADRKQQSEPDRDWETFESTSV